MIWAKTGAGRAEIQARVLVRERAQRNLLLLIDGQKSDELLIAQLAGIKAEDFTALEAMGLIEPVVMPERSGVARSASISASASTPAAPIADATPSDYVRFTEVLTQIIAKELGLRGFALSLAVEKAGTIHELMEVARRVIDQIGDRKGASAAEAARQSLFGH